MIQGPASFWYGRGLILLPASPPFQLGMCLAAAWSRDIFSHRAAQLESASDDGQVFGVEVVGLTLAIAVRAELYDHHGGGAEFGRAIHVVGFAGPRGVDEVREVG